MASLKGYRPGSSPFDRIRNFTEDGEEWWSARELGEELRYARWEDVLSLIGKAKIACRSNGHSIPENFREAPKVFTHQSGRQQVVADVQMTRYACYMVALSGNSTKPEIAAAKNYFAIATRAAEVGSKVVIHAAPLPATRLGRSVSANRSCPTSKMFRSTIRVASRS